MNKIDIVKKNVNKAIPYFALILFFGAMLFSFFKYELNKPGTRYLMYFDNYEDDLCTEMRFIKDKSRENKEQVFVDELLLGPLTDRYKPLFSRGTKTEFCFTKGKTLYINLSADALQITRDTADIKRGLELLKKNIFRNFNNINTVLLYINGKSV